MSRSGEITLEFGGEERVFRLGIGQWRKVQEACDAGPAELLARLSPAFMAAEQGLTFDQIVGMGLLGRWRLDDIREPILQGLLGANMAGPDATKLVKDWVDERPFLESVRTAYKIVMASVVGVEDEEAAGESEAVGAEPDLPLSPTASSASVKTGSTRSGRRAAATPPETLTQ